MSIPRSAQRRLLAVSRDLAAKEQAISELLGLRIRPSLSLLDEASAVYVTSADRAALHEAAGDLAASEPGPAPGAQDERR